MLGQELLATGLLIVAPASMAPSDIVDLGSIPILQFPSSHPLRLHSPIIARDHIPEYVIEVLPLEATGRDDAD